MPLPTDKTSAERLLEEHDAALFGTINTIIANRVRAGSPPMPIDQLAEQLDLVRLNSKTRLHALFFDAK